MHLPFSKIGPALVSRVWDDGRNGATFICQTNPKHICRKLCAQLGWIVYSIWRSPQYCSDAGRIVRLSSMTLVFRKAPEKKPLVKPSPDDFLGDVLRVYLRLLYKDHSRLELTSNSGH